MIDPCFSCSQLNPDEVEFGKEKQKKKGDAGLANFSRGWLKPPLSLLQSDTQMEKRLSGKNPTTAKSASIVKDGELSSNIIKDCLDIQII